MFIIESIFGNTVVQRGFANTREDARYINKMIHGSRIREIKNVYAVPQYWDLPRFRKVV